MRTKKKNIQHELQMRKIENKNSFIEHQLKKKCKNKKKKE